MLVKLVITNGRLEFLNLNNGNNQILNEVKVPLAVSGCVQVDDIAFAEAQTNWDIGDGTYSENCSGDLTYVPDDSFEQALIDLGYDDVLDDYVLTANIDTIAELTVNEKNISDLTGLEAFEALEVLDCYSNRLTQLDVSQLKNLKVLLCGFNVIESLITKKNSELEELDISFNHILELDLSQNSKLTNLYTHFNRFDSLDVSKNVNLKTLEIGSRSSFEQLDISNNLALVDLSIIDTGLHSLDVSQNPLLSSLNVIENPSLTCIKVANLEEALTQSRWYKDDGASYSENCDHLRPCELVHYH